MASPRSPLLAVLALAAAPAIGLGVGRFAYALVLPDMQAAFGWTYSQAGLPNTFNAVGYLIGAFCASRAAALVGGMRLVVGSALVAVAATTASAAVNDLAMLCALRIVLGVAGAFCLAGGGAVAIGLAQAAGPGRSLAAALFYIGPPLGIVVSALVAPATLLVVGETSWRATQLGLGAASLVLFAALMSRPLRGADAMIASGSGERAPLKPMAPLLVGYFCYGAGYIVYMTFMIAFLRHDGASPSQQAAFWCVLGAMGLASPWIWAPLFARMKGGLAAAAATLVTAIGACAPLIATSALGHAASAAIFGLGVFATTAATTVFLQHNLPSRQWASGVGAMTVAFSLGQIIGPVISGAVTDYAGGLDAGLAVGAALLLLGAMISSAQRMLASPSACPGKSGG